MVDAGDVLGIQSEGAPFLDQGDQQVLFALVVTDGTGIGLFGAGDLDAEGSCVWPAGRAAPDPTG